MEIGDRVRLSADATSRVWRFSARWAKREGTVMKKAHRGDEVGVIWDGRSSLDWWSERVLELVDES